MTAREGVAAMTDRLPIEVRPYTPLDRQGVCTLLQKTFNNLAPFDRYERDNPLGEFIGAVAELEGRVVGFNMWNAWLVHTADGPITAYQSGGSAVDDLCRGQGVFGRLLQEGERQAVERGIEYFIGFPNPASLKAFLRAGWEYVKNLRFHVELVPALWPRARCRATDADEGEVLYRRFAAWRYARGGAFAIHKCDRSGRPLWIYYSVVRAGGLPVVRLLDIVDAEGRRDLTQIRHAARWIPGPAPITLRCSETDALLGQCTVTINRKWDTPLILRAVANANLTPLREADYCYGDIDVA
jgi:GNAT superfamily N-acetyltransferase